MGNAGRRLFWLTSGCLSAAISYALLQHWQAIGIYPAEARSELREALLAVREGRSGDAERNYHKALQTTASQTGDASKATISILLQMADFYRTRNRPDRAASIYESILEREKASNSKGGEETARVAKALADIYLSIERYGRAEELLLQAQGLLEEQEALHKQLGPIFESLGELRFREGRFADAGTLYQRAAEYCAHDQSSDLATYLTLLNNAASCHYMHRTADSLHRARQIAQQAIDASHGASANVADLVSNLQMLLDDCKQEK